MKRRAALNVFILTGGSESGGGGRGEEGGDTEGDRNGEMRDRKKERKKGDGEKGEVFKARTFLHFQKQSSREATETVCGESLFQGHLFFF